MSEDTQDDLLLLARSLTQNEKRYLSLHIGKQLQPDWVQLMSNLFRHQQSEREFLAAVKSQFPLPKKRSAVRRKLYEKMLDLLVEYELAHNPDLQLQKLIQRCRVLHLRGLYTSGEVMLRKGLKLARKYDRKWALAELTELQCSMQSLHQLSPKKKQRGDALWQESYLAANEYATYRKLSYMDSVLAMTFNQQGAISEGSDPHWLAFDEIAEFASRESGFYIPYLARHIQINLATLRGQPEKMYEKWMETSKMFEEHPWMIPGNETSYLRMLHSRAIMAVSVNHKEEANEMLTLLKNAEPKRSLLKASWVQMYLYSLAQVTVRFGDKKGMETFIQLFQELVPTYRDRMEQVYVFVMEFHLVVAHMQLGAYKAAIRQVNLCLHSEDLHLLKKGIQILATLRLCLYVEIEDWDNLEQMLDKTRSFLAQKIIFPRFWALSEAFFSQLVQHNHPNAKEAAVTSFISGCEKLFYKEGDETNVIAYFDFLKWGKAVLIGVPMGVFVGGKA